MYVLLMRSPLRLEYTEEGMQRRRGARVLHLELTLPRNSPPSVLRARVEKRYVSLLFVYGGAETPRLAESAIAKYSMRVRVGRVTTAAAYSL